MEEKTQLKVQFRRTKVELYGKKQWLFKNKLMCFLSEASAFCKLIFFFLPIFLFLPIFWLLEYLRDAVPYQVYWLGEGASLGFFVVAWGYLIINAQVHWELGRRCFAANIISFVVVLAWIILFFCPLNVL